MSKAEKKEIEEFNIAVKSSGCLSKWEIFVDQNEAIIQFNFIISFCRFDMVEFITGTVIKTGMISD